MRKYLDNSSESLTPRWLCTADADAKSKENSKLYTKAQLAYANRVFKNVMAAYQSETVFKNIRQKFVAIKVDRPSREKMIEEAVYALDRFCDENNIDIVRTTENVIYRVSRKLGM